MEDRATFRKLELNDGQEVEMCLTFGRLLKLREKCPEVCQKILLPTCSFPLSQYWRKENNQKEIVSE